MTFMWFALAAVALFGALALLYVDRTRREQSGRVREIWARAQGYKYSSSDDQLPSHWHRAALAKQEYLGAIDVVRGVRRGENFTLFDIEETATIIAVRRKVGADVDIDLRLKSTPPPKDADMNLLGSIGPRIVFATDLEIARRVCDQRMVSFTQSIPDHVQMLWSEGEWTWDPSPWAAPDANGTRPSRRSPGCRGFCMCFRPLPDRRNPGSLPAASTTRAARPPIADISRRPGAAATIDSSPGFGTQWDAIQLTSGDECCMMTAPGGVSIRRST